MQNPTKVGDVYQRLQAFREEKEREKKESEQKQQEEAARLERERIERETQANAPKRLNFLESSAIDFLDIYPLRKWRQLKEHYPLQCWVITGALWLTGQILAIHAQFGLVFALFSAFVLMFLQLGVRAEGEMSAYSVFNPNCERLLGQITAEDFERDMLMQRREN